MEGGTPTSILGLSASVMQALKRVVGTMHLGCIGWVLLATNAGTNYKLDL